MIFSLLMDSSKENRATIQKLNGNWKQSLHSATLLYWGKKLHFELIFDVTNFQYFRYCNMNNLDLWTNLQTHTSALETEICGIKF